MNLRSLPSFPHWLVPNAKLRIRLIYLWRHGRLPDLDDPKRFTEFVQRRKLSDRDPRMAGLISKVTAKATARGYSAKNGLFQRCGRGIYCPTIRIGNFPSS